MSTINRRTDVELVIEACKGRGGTWGREEAVVAHMQQAKGWHVARTKSAILKAVNGPAPVYFGRGETLKFSGTDAAIYEDVRLRVQSSWADSRGFRNPLARNISSRHSARGLGDWMYPDLVLLADPKRRDTEMDPLEIHTLEVERAKGFTIQSVYQAYEQGRGANYAWVFFLGSKDELSESWRRILRAATELKVGLVAMRRVDLVGTWVVKLPAERRRKPVEGDRTLLLLATGVTDSELQERRRKK